MLRSTGHGFCGHRAQGAAPDPAGPRRGARRRASSSSTRSSLRSPSWPRADVIVACDGVASWVRDALAAELAPRGRRPAEQVRVARLHRAVPRVHVPVQARRRTACSASTPTAITSTARRSSSSAASRHLAARRPRRRRRGQHRRDARGDLRRRARRPSADQEPLDLAQLPDGALRHWHAGNVVLVGDAAHTAHFSIGSGTKLAMEDAIALRDELLGGRATSTPRSPRTRRAAGPRSRRCRPRRRRASSGSRAPSATRDAAGAVHLQPDDAQPAGVARVGRASAIRTSRAASSSCSRAAAGITDRAGAAADRAAADDRRSPRALADRASRPSRRGRASWSPAARGRRRAGGDRAVADRPERRRARRGPRRDVAQHRRRRPPPRRAGRRAARAAGDRPRGRRGRRRARRGRRVRSAAARSAARATRATLRRRRAHRAAGAAVAVARTAWRPAAGSPRRSATARPRAPPCRPRCAARPRRRGSAVGVGTRRRATATAHGCPPHRSPIACATSSASRPRSSAGDALLADLDAAIAAGRADLVAVAAARRRAAARVNPRRYQLRKEAVGVCERPPVDLPRPHQLGGDGVSRRRAGCAWSTATTASSATASTRRAARSRSACCGAGPSAPDAAWLRAQLDRRDRRAAPRSPTRTDALRLIHGESDGLPAVVVDRFGDTLVVASYAAGADALARYVARALRSARRAPSSARRATSLLRPAHLRRAAAEPMRVLRGAPPDVAHIHRGRHRATRSISPPGRRPARTSICAACAARSPRRRSPARACSTCSRTPACSAAPPSAPAPPRSSRSTPPSARSRSPPRHHVDDPARHRFVIADVFDWLPTLRRAVRSRRSSIRRR